MGIDLERGPPLRLGLLAAIQLIERGRQDQMRLQDFGHELDRLLERAYGPFGIARGVEAQSEKIGQAGGARLELEAGAKGLHRTPILAMIAKPLAELTIEVRLGVSCQLRRERLRAHAGGAGVGEPAETSGERQPGAKKHDPQGHRSSDLGEPARTASHARSIIEPQGSLQANPRTGEPYKGEAYRRGNPQPLPEQYHSPDPGGRAQIAAKALLKRHKNGTIRI
jgi:hypothetical protein